MYPEEIFIPIVLFVVVALVLYKFIEARHKERMAIIEKNLDPIAYKEMYAKWTFKISPLSNLKWGLITLFIGIGILISYQYNAWYHTEDFTPALIFVAGGFALVVFYIIAMVVRKRDSSQ